VTPQAVLGATLLALVAAALAVGIARLAPGRSPGELALGGAATIAGAVVCLAVLRYGRRGLRPHERWLVLVLLVAALFANRLGSGGKFALLAFGAGYVVAFVAAIVLRIVRVTRSGKR